jgi:hypothetical protein
MSQQRPHDCALDMIVCKRVPLRERQEHDLFCADLASPDVHGVLPPGAKRERSVGQVLFARFRKASSRPSKVALRRPADGDQPCDLAFGRRDRGRSVRR